MSNIYRTIHWDEPVRKVRYFVLKGGVDEYKRQLKARGLRLDHLEVDQIEVNTRGMIVQALNEAVGYGEVIYGGKEAYTGNLFDE
mgnify:CR=1 FL=1